MHEKYPLSTLRKTHFRAYCRKKNILKAGLKDLVGQNRWVVLKIFGPKKIIKLKRIQIPDKAIKSTYGYSGRG